MPIVPQHGGADHGGIQEAVTIGTGEAGTTVGTTGGSLAITGAIALPTLICQVIIPLRTRGWVVPSLGVLLAGRWANSSTIRDIALTPTPTVRRASSPTMVVTPTRSP